MFKADHIALAVADLGRSRAFYEALGGRVVSRPSPHFVELMLGNLRLHIVPRDQVSGPDSARPPVGLDHFSVSVDSVAALERLRDFLNTCPVVERFAPFAIEDSEMLGQGLAEHAEERPPAKTLYAKDPDGITLEVRCYH